MRTRRAAAVAVTASSVVIGAATIATACTSERESASPRGAPPHSAGVTSQNPASPNTTQKPGGTSTAAQPLVPAGPGDSADVGAAIVEVPYRIEVLSPDGSQAAFPNEVARTLDDERGWQRAGFRFRLEPDAEYRVVLAEPDDAQQLCQPYDVYRTYSCQNGPDVVINADRWREATPQWTGDLATYRVMLINHEVGHLLGMRHPEVQCPAPGQPAPVMAQQSTELRGCAPNPWPLPHEIERASRHDLPLAPPYER